MTAVADARIRRVVPALRPERRVVAGVAAGIAAALGVEPVVVRAAFVVLAAAGGLGVLLYLLSWVVMARAGQPVEAAAMPAAGELGPLDRVIGVALVTVGLVLLVEALDLGFGRSTVWPVVLLGLGLLLAWHRKRLGAFVDGRSAAVRVVAGLVVAGTGLAGLVIFNLDIAAARDTLLVLAAVVGGVALVVAPAIAGLARDLADERRQRIRTEERERMAAHLHDSVLQTLALIQRDADEPGRTRALARGQERELRAWLYGADQDAGVGTVRAALERACAEIERLHDVPVELVVVGADIPLGERLQEAVQATREAIVNAAKHSGAARVDVYAEVEGATLQVFVRDTGTGFDPRAVAADRRGLRESVVARVQRVGGSAEITSAPGHGTEVELRVPLEPR